MEKSFDYENGYWLTSAPSRFEKAIAHYELYKKITTLPGDIVECGVFKGSSLIRFATFREMLESQSSRKIWGFDAFGEFPKDVESEDDKEFIEKFDSAAGQGICVEELERVLANKGFSNINLVKGDIVKTLPEYLQNSAWKIALLHIDVDVYEPTKFALEQLYDRVVAGGEVVLDDYATVAGATRAVDEFIAKRHLNASIQKLPFNYIPCFIVKDHKI
jgi:hypothetical protein